MFTPDIDIEYVEPEYDEIGHIVGAYTFVERDAGTFQYAEKLEYTSTGAFYYLMDTSGGTVGLLRGPYTNPHESSVHTLYQNQQYYDGYAHPIYREEINYTRNPTYSSLFYGQDSETYKIYTTIPIFRDTDTDALNNYINNGDTSGAVNDDTMIHPLTATLTITIDGTKDVHLYMKATLDEHHVNTVMICRIKSMSNPLLFMDVSFNHGTTKDFNWFEIKDKIGALALLGVNIGFYPAAAGDDSSSRAGTNITSDGSVSQNPAVSADGTVTIVCKKGEPDEDYDYPTDDSDYNQDTNTHNTFSGSNTLTKTYKLSNNRLQDLGAFLWGASFFDNIKLLNNSPIENIISVKAMPVNMTGTEESITIGNVNTGVLGEVINNSDSINVLVGRTYIGGEFQNFLDYTATTINIYLPYIGFKQLNNAIVINNTIEVSYIFDCILGKCMAIISVVDDSGHTSEVECYEGNCGIDIAIAASNRSAVEAGLITNAIGGVISIASGNVGGVVSSLEAGATQQFHSQSNGVGSPSLLVNMTNTVYLLIETPKKFTPQKYGHYIGYPCHLYKKLSSLSGFTVCENFIASGIGKATSEEKEMIEELMNSGVFIN